VRTLFFCSGFGLLGYVRISGHLRRKIPAEYLRVGEGLLPPAKIVDVHHHFSNQFEVPVLFYLACITALAAESVDRETVTLAWSFVSLRVVHTAIILVKNDPLDSRRSLRAQRVCCVGNVGQHLPPCRVVCRLTSRNTAPGAGLTDRPAIRECSSRLRATVACGPLIGRD